MWKLATAVIAEEMYDYLEQEKLLPEEQKNADEEVMEQRINCLLIRLSQYCKKRDTNLTMALIDGKNMYDFVWNSWINECMELFGTVNNVRNFLKKIMERWKFSLTSNGEDLGEDDAKKGRFQGDSLLPWLFVLSMVTL